MTSPHAKISEPPPPVVMDVPSGPRFDPTAIAALRSRFEKAQRTRTRFIVASVALLLVGVGVAGKLAMTPERIISAPPAAAAAAPPPPESNASIPIAKAPDAPAPSATVIAPASSTTSSSTAKSIASKAPRAKSPKRR